VSKRVADVLIEVLAVCSAKAVLHGKGGDLWEMVTENI
jgi:hypothetical protein